MYILSEYNYGHSIIDVCKKKYLGYFVLKLLSKVFSWIVLIIVTFNEEVYLY